MNFDRLQMLTHVYSCLVDAAKLPESGRSYSVQSNLTEIEEQIMEEVNTNRAAKTPPPTNAKLNNDDIPF